MSREATTIPCTRKVIPGVSWPTPLIVILGWIPAVTSFGQSTLWDQMAPQQPRSYVCREAPSPPAIDGRLDDSAWREAPWTKPFVDIEGTAKPAPRFRTRAKMLWDETYFYIAAQLDEPHVWGTLTEHDAVIFHDNDFEVFIDPDGDNHEYYEFEMNALNTGWDLFLPRPYLDGGKADNSWEIPGLQTAVFVDGTLNDPSDEDRGWSVEIAIPWSALERYAHRPCPPRPGDQWRVNFSRVEWEHRIEGKKYEKVAGRREDNWVWSPQGIINMHRPERWGFVQFATQEADQNFEPDPSIPARDFLMHVYHRQRAYHKQHDAWADSFEKLGLAAEASQMVQPKLAASSVGFQASVRTPVRGGGQRRLRINEKSQLRPMTADTP